MCSVYYYQATLKDFPRGLYFGRRYKDVATRLAKILRALPKSFLKEEFFKTLNTLSEDVGKSIQIAVYGQPGLSREDIFFLPESASFTEGHPSENDIKVLVCFTEVDCDHPFELAKIDSLLQQIDVKAIDEGITVLICLIRASSNEDCSALRETVFEKIQGHFCNLKNFDVFVSEDKTELSRDLSKVFETKFVSGLLFILKYLQRFMGKTSFYQPRTTKLLHSKHVVKGILVFLRNGFSLADAVSSTPVRRTWVVNRLLKKLALVLKCLLTNTFSEKFEIPRWVCVKVMCELDFETKIIGSISKRTRKKFGKLSSYAISCQTVLKNRLQGQYSYRNDTKCVAFDYILKSIQFDVSKATEEIQKPMMSVERLLALIKKIAFEIEGYVKQSEVKLDMLSTKSDVKIPSELRRDLLSLPGVFGLGTIYGDMEIHIEENTDEDPVSLIRKLQDLLKRKRFAYPYTIKTVKYTP